MQRYKKIKGWGGFVIPGLLIFVFLGAMLSCTPGVDVKKQKQMADAWKLGQVYMQQREYTKALRQFLAAEPLYQDNSQFQNELGYVYLIKKEYDLAIVHFKQAMDVDPDPSSREVKNATNNLGVTYMRLNQWDAAIKIFKTLSKDYLYETPHIAYTNLGWAFYNKGEYLLALQYYREALALRSNSVLALRGLGMTYQAMGKHKEAVEVYETAVKKAPGFARLQYDLAEAYVLVDQNRNARKSFQTVMEMVPDTPLAVKAAAEIGKLTGK
jgi:type IV pilus assembly protein PilF